MDILMCPVCKNNLIKEKSRYVCKNNHSFDVSKKGYVNLLMSNAKGEKRHGDDKAMAEARADFLNLGHYKKLSDKISEFALLSKEQNPKVFECGCGECYYIDNVSKAFQEKGRKAFLYGMDISKDVLPFGKKRNKEITLFAASAFKLPIEDESVDIALSIFAPASMEEISRILKKGGLFIKIIPLEEHLIELKRELYENVYLNRPVTEENDNFILSKTERLEYFFQLSNKDEIQKLFKMTPYYYKTGIEAQNKLLQTQSLKVKASFGIALYIKK